MKGLICYGPDSGQEATFVRADQWLPKQKEISEKEAQRVLLRRYLRTYGPVTIQHFSRWTGFSIAEAKAAWKLLEEEIVEVSVEDSKGWILRKGLKPLGKSDSAGQVLRLLPSLDPYLLGHADKSHLVDARNYKRIFRNAGWISPVVLLNGKVIGAWSHKRMGNRVHLAIEPFVMFSKQICAKVEEEAASLGAFLETSWEIRLRPY